MSLDITRIRFDQNGLVPAVVQHAETGDVLTVAYMNEESLKKTLETKETWFWSRSREELWHKGETSGNTQQIAEIKLDCDQDSLVVRVLPKGPACHTGAQTCFEETVYQNEDLQLNEDSAGMLTKLERLIAERDEERPEGAYTTYLFEEGVDKILKKVGEEASEVIIAAKNRDAEELKWETADLLYHTMVLLREQKLPFKEVLNVLEERHNKPKK
ncbi:bifunctional phosphoribosyl-AMP cyclohydrolase/phosphoribosyl-ATP diphosphatase HisIE [Jeotgalibacillus sp. ET6]|uniref:bifunctional phosphoribosyl-AMP cyclohydrolase/phosphoribosyl-ATP diphosphatase HisIE n=1 Tax=Jeotgalibacillus sp. ET6 TaxID=3037260 RepID=UPI0024183A81|nr:bifunctional phosphoribosyl-AMP cyclohydrolase/phosphoribosyl-ATP diphosphatase HisIE [Jeotgalibacillus sp. ET6]MDG5471668.1 bifunctional phosphoribosyl-AMP cyclohydrolase/phosphoribosyl-ATP diphosphatase HisIE [Jeotgalibacillus sp. ET6]